LEGKGVGDESFEGGSRVLHFDVHDGLLAHDFAAFLLQSLACRPFPGLLLFLFLLLCFVCIIWLFI
jgi:hypothetical protein